MAGEVKERAFILKWRSAIWNSTLPSSAKLACICLSEFANSDGSKCFPSLPTIAHVTGLNEKTVRRNLALVVKAGFIVQIALGTSKGWKAHRYELPIPEGADISRVRPEDGTDTTPVPPERGTDTAPGASDPTYGHSVHEVRTLCPDGTGVVPTDLSSTYPIPIKEQQRHHEATSPSEAPPEWVDLATWNQYFKTHSRYPVTAFDARRLLDRLEWLRADGHDPSQCLEQAWINGWWDVWPMVEED